MRQEVNEVDKSLGRTLLSSVFCGKQVGGQLRQRGPWDCKGRWRMTMTEYYGAEPSMDTAAAANDGPRMRSRTRHYIPTSRVAPPAI